jgi:hypothetical protein
VRREDDDCDDHLEDMVGVNDLLIGDIEFCQLYLTRSNYTVAWPAQTQEFMKAHGDAHYFIHQQLKSNREAHKLSWTDFETQVTLVISGEIQQYHCRSMESDDYKQLENLLSESSFARYDFNCTFDDGTTAKYAFSAENAQAKSKESDEPKESGEIAVRIPRVHYLTKPVFDEWMFEKHIADEALQLKLDTYPLRHSVYVALMEMALTKPIN